jgi:hypothetical protein
MKELLDKGCRRFAWIEPDENVPGHNGDDEEFGHGAFAYTFDDPALDCYFPVKAITPVVRPLAAPDAPEAQSVVPAKPFEKWDVKEVCRLFESIGFAQAANVIKQNCVDGKTLISADFDQYLTMGIAKGGLGGLGLKPLQKIRFKTEIEQIQKQCHVKEVCGQVESIGFAGAADVIKSGCHQNSKIGTWVSSKFEKWDVKEVCRLFESIGFAQAANVIKQNCVDGKTLISADFDQYLTMGIAEGGLGLEPLQKIRFKTEIEQIQKQCHVKEVCGLVESIGFAEAADVIKKNCFDGKTLISADFDQRLTMGIAEACLVLKPMQKMRFKTEIEQYCVKNNIASFLNACSREI